MSKTIKIKKRLDTKDELNWSEIDLFTKAHYYLIEHTEIVTYFRDKIKSIHADLDALDRKIELDFNMQELDSLQKESFHRTNDLEDLLLKFDNTNYLTEFEYKFIDTRLSQLSQRIKSLFVSILQKKEYHAS